jgi:hypothetical protein
MSTALSPGFELAPSRRSFGDHLGALAMGAVDGVTLNWADEALGLVNQDWRDEWRRNQEEARDNHGRLYFGGQIGSAFVPGLGLVRGAGALTRGTGLARMLGQPGMARNVAGILAGSAAGVGYGATARAGDAEDGERLTAAANPMGIMGDAALGGALGAIGTFLGANVAGRAVEEARRAGRARTAFNEARDAAEETARTAQQRAQAIAPLEWIDSTRREGVRNMDARTVGAVTGEAARLQDQLRDLGVDSLTRSQLVGDRLDQTDFWKAYEGFYGDRARDRALAVADRQRQQIQQGFGRVMDTPAGRMTPDQMPASATQGAQRILEGLQGRFAQENEAVRQAWDTLTPEVLNARLRASPTAGRQVGARDLYDTVMTRIRDPRDGLDTDVRGNLLFESADPVVAQQARSVMPRTALAHRNLQMLNEMGGSLQDAGTLRTVLGLRRQVLSLEQDAVNRGAAQDARGLLMMRRAIDDWMDTRLPDNITMRGTQGAELYRDAARATREREAFFGDDRTISRGVNDEAFREDPSRWLGLLIGKRGVEPSAGATATLERIRDRFGADSDVWQNTRAAVLSRFTDQIEDAMRRGVSGDPLVMTAVQGSIQRLFRDHPAFMDALFSPAEQDRLMLLAQAAMRTQSPGRGAIGPSTEGLAALANLIPGAETGRRVFDTIRGPGIVRREMQELAPPGPMTAVRNVVTSPASYLLGPQSIAGDVGVQSMGAAATNAALISQDNDRRIRERDRRERIERLRAMMTGENPQSAPAASTEEDEFLRRLREVREERARRAAMEAQQQGQPQ